MSMQDAGQLLPATRSETDSFSLTEEDFPPLPPSLRYALVLQWRCPDWSGSRLTRGGGPALPLSGQSAFIPLWEVSPNDRSPLSRVFLRDVPRPLPYHYVKTIT